MFNHFELCFCITHSMRHIIKYCVGHEHNKLIVVSLNNIFYFKFRKSLILSNDFFQYSIIKFYASINNLNLIIEISSFKETN